jgi:hypothetical protein
MPQDEETVAGDHEVDEEVTCDEQHVADLDDQAKVMLSTFTTVRSKIQDVLRAEAGIKSFELSIEADRKRLQKSLEAAKLGLRNARVQMAVELEKVDGIGFMKAADRIKEANRA